MTPCFWAKRTRRSRARCISLASSRSASQIKLQENQSTTPANRQTRILPESRNSRQIKALGVLHGRLVLRSPAASGFPCLTSEPGRKESRQFQDVVPDIFGLEAS